MKLKFYPKTGLIGLFVLFGTVNMLSAQDCSGLTATFISRESRCTATGTLQINASGGSGTYNYKVTGTTASDFTSSDLITGLPPGTYTVTVKDVISGCTFDITNIIITGSYSDPRFGITESDVTCVNGNDGVVSVAALTNGRGPFSFTLVAPSAMGIGTTNATGTFTGLVPGSYSVQMTDSCGGLQTRNISVQNYTWSISSAPVSLVSCTSYQATVNLLDSKGNTNASGTAFNGFQYGVVNNAGDTSWFTTPAFNFDLGQKRTVTLVAKDRCGKVLTKNWTNTVIPSVAANATIGSVTCTGFTAAITGMQNLHNPTYCLYDNLGNTVAGQACNSTGAFSNLPFGSYCIKITNTCYDTVITRCFSLAKPAPAITGAVTLSAYTCTTVTATVTGQQNLINPQYCLFDNLGNAVGACNSTGIFAGVPYGAYSIKATDGCTGSVLTVNFNAAKRVRSVAAAVTMNGYTCTTFVATVTGASNLTTPQYCLVDNLGNPIVCNNTGIFTGLTYGSYCVNITDACGDTSIRRCFTGVKPPPGAGAPVFTNKTCTGFTVTAAGLTNVFNGQFCLLDYLGNPAAGIPCNSTGVFTNVPYGNYCLKITDGCSNADLLKCFSVSPPVPAVGLEVTSNLTCAGFTATVSAQQNLTTPSFCLFDQSNNQIGTCNSTGIFNITSFGNFTIKTTDGCAGAVFTTSFSVLKPVASVGPTVNFTNQTCTSFSATINGQANLSGANYSLKNSSGTVISTNHTGAFDNLAYGSYCIDVTNSCNDTTIERCFTETAPANVMTVTAAPSCLYFASDLTVSVTSGFSPYVVSVYDTLNNLIKTVTSSSSNIVISQIPALIPGQKYKVVVSGACGTPATAYVLGRESALTHTYTIIPKCPSTITPNGTADLQIAATTTLSGVNLSITQKNFSPVSIGYSTRTGNNFTFSNLDNAVYVITYSFTGCSTTIKDTVTLPNYAFPNLGRSAAYQCDNNSFSVGAAVSGGISPFSYQVIGSVPSAPNINSAAPQSNPVFTINNGVQYSLVRLRAIDACGNAALNDVSILPLANSIVMATSNCIHQNITLSTDVLPNATYTWYKKSTANATDSIMVGSGPTYNVPYLTPSDTGVYVSQMSINNGCLTKLSYFHLDGMCGGLWTLPQAVTLKGHALAETANQLTWDAPANINGVTYQIERKNENSGAFEPIGTVQGNPEPGSYSFVDNSVEKGVNFYRLKMISTDNQFTYSNIIQIKTNGTDQISIYPNPVSKVLNINIQNSQSQHYQVVLYTIAGQVIYTGSPVTAQNITLVYHRDSFVAPGLYLLKVKNLSTGETNSYKVIFGQE